jgi:hypothetical protein
MIVPTTQRASAPAWARPASLQFDLVFDTETFRVPVELKDVPLP